MNGASRWLDAWLGAANGAAIAAKITAVANARRARRRVGKWANMEIPPSGRNETVSLRERRGVPDHALAVRRYTGGAGNRMQVRPIKSPLSRARLESTS